MPAILQRLHPLTAQATRPGKQGREPLCANLDRLLAHDLTYAPWDYAKGPDRLAGS